MTIVQAKELLQLVSLYGVPSLFMVMVLGLMIKVLIWARPRAESIVENHLKLMRTMRVGLRRLVQAAESNSRTMEEVKTTTQLQTKLLEDHHQLALKIAAKMEINDAYGPMRTRPDQGGAGQT